MRISKFFLGASLLTLTACGPGFNQEVGGPPADFGNATMNNTLIQSGQKDYTIALAGRFAREVPSTITFAFDSAQLDARSIPLLRQQADWIKTFPEVRFRVYGHTDLVGTSSYNKSLGLRRAKAVVAYFASQGISRDRLEALASFGETRPLVQTAAPEERNRRTVTEVSGFVKNHPALLNGKYAAVIHREYIELAKRPHPSNQVIVTQTNPG
ncbi:OmpA family protein (plasmid) [Pseudorhodobacter turbinis]|uniref:OmpA family protein n=1 Tax=Pseudorhodobacter turbinis TaxID=2500533 RepID=A0A4P8EJU9_9RHOB|nr:OmpA family protein [Pseudorhodobacter turbinis]QCO57326.1 OmpA family protein [Pseudorhodobacter turbinis]